MIRQTASNNAYGVVVDIYGTLSGVNDKSGAVGHGMFINGNISDDENCPVVNIYEGALEHI